MSVCTDFKRVYQHIQDRFWPFVDVRPKEECWNWQGEINADGYGRICINYKRELATRIACQLYYGYYDNNLCVLHRCDNRKCVSPYHLFLGTRRTNIKDAYAKGRLITNKHYKFPGGFEHHSSIFSREDVLRIKELLKITPVLKIASMYNTSDVTIYKIKNGITYSDVI